MLLLLLLDALDKGASSSSSSVCTNTTTSACCCCVGVVAKQSVVAVVEVMLRFIHPCGGRGSLRRTFRGGGCKNANDDEVVIGTILWRNSPSTNGISNMIIMMIMIAPWYQPTLG